MILPVRYQLTGASSGGGMGDILECTDTHLERRVVLKILKDGVESRRLLDEQKALIKLRSKHVIQLYDVITIQENSVSKTALVLEHIEGTDLGPGAITPGEKHLNTLWQIACGLVDIHRESVIHRDIKPNNIRVDTTGVIKILDFGLARCTGTEAKTLSIIGTLGYMAPELWKNTSVSFDQSIDVYAFGVMALTLINAPIPNELCQQPPKSLPAGALNGIFSGMPTDVVTIIEKCLSYDPSHRPTMGNVEPILRRHLLYNKHRALLVLGGNTHEINAATPSVNVKSGTIGVIGINYNGVKFIVSSLSGSVFVNNKVIDIGDDLPECCVITFGLKYGPRSFATFDVSYPEVMP